MVNSHTLYQLSYQEIIKYTTKKTRIKEGGKEEMAEWFKAIDCKSINKLLIILVGSNPTLFKKDSFKRLYIHVFSLIGENTNLLNWILKVRIL